jgi:hypothetical protein
MGSKIQAVVCVAVVIGPTWWLLATGDRSARIATVLVVSIDLLGLIISLFDVLLYRRSDDSVLAAEAQLHHAPASSSCPHRRRTPHAAPTSSC